MKYIIFSRTVIVIFYIQYVEPDYVNNKLTVGSGGYTFTESFDNAEALTVRLAEVGNALKVEEEDILKLVYNEADKA